jgi:hypothetical protein
MKIRFIIPGDTLTLLDDVQEPLECIGYSKREPYNGYTPKKGDQFKVSQVYIRNNGWFESSITLRACGGPILDALSANIAGQKLRLADEELARLKEIKSRFDRLPADTTWLCIPAQNYNKFPIIFQGCNWQDFEQLPHGSCDTGGRKIPNSYKTKDDMRYGNDNFPSDSSRSRFIKEKMQGLRDGAFFFKKDLLNDTLVNENEIKQLKNRTKAYKVNSNVRLRLSTIEKWEVEISREDKK